MRGGRLEGVRVLVTRPRERAEELCFLLEDEGAEVIAVPLLEVRPPDDPRPLQSAADQIHRFTWIALVSPFAVQALWDATRVAGTVEALSRTKIAVVGPGTASAVLAFGLKVALEASEPTAVGLLEALKGVLSPQDQVLLPAAQEGRAELAAGLDELGVPVTRIAAYRADPAAIEPKLKASLISHPPRLALFGSPRTAEALLQALGDDASQVLSTTRAVAIGPTTATALAALGLGVSAVAARPTSEGLVDAAILALSG